MTNNNEARLSMAERIIDFNRGLTYLGQLPTGFAVLNPYTDNETMEAWGHFYVVLSVINKVVYLRNVL